MAGLYTQLASRFVFPLHEAVKGHATIRTLRRLEASQWWPRERIEADRLERLRFFLADIDAHVPFFREQFRQRRFDPRSVDALDALQALPLMTKSDVRANADQLRADDAGRLKPY